MQLSKFARSRRSQMVKDTNALPSQISACWTDRFDRKQKFLLAPFVVIDVRTPCVKNPHIVTDTYGDPHCTFSSPDNFYLLRLFLSILIQYDQLSPYLSTLPLFTFLHKQTSMPKCLQYYQKD